MSGLDLLKAGLYFPSRKKKQEYMQIVEALVKQYQPRIEEMTGVDLGEISLSGYQDLGRINYESIMDWWVNDQKYVFGKNVFTDLLIYASFKGSSWIGEKLNEDRHYMSVTPDNILQVPFGFRTKQLLLVLKPCLDHHILDQLVVHELSHVLWNRIAGNDVRFPEYDLRRPLFEGFAVYCQEDEFAGLYPENHKLPLPNAYRNGKKLIERVLQDEGKEYLFKIPLQWRELNRKYSEKK